MESMEGRSCRPCRLVLYEAQRNDREGRRVEGTDVERDVDRERAEDKGGWMDGTCECEEVGDDADADAAEEEEDACAGRTADFKLLSDEERSRKVS